MFKKCPKTNIKYLSTKFKELLNTEYKTSSWQIHSYGDNLQLTSTRIPLIKDPNEVLVKVEAFSINPIDVLMLGGYGRNLFKIPRKCENELPLTLGRDFCGTVVQKGISVNDNINIGDKVYGFVPVTKQGTFTGVTVAHEDHVSIQTSGCLPNDYLINLPLCQLCPKPPNLSNVESASLVYTSMTAWSALYITGGLMFKTSKSMKILILGTSGGVGNAAIQILRSQGYNVIGTCSTDAMPLVYSLGVNKVFDYSEKNYWNNVSQEGPYDIVLDCAKVDHKNIPKTVNYTTYIALNSPLLLNTDKYGLINGLLMSAGNLISSNLENPGRFVKWGFFIPSRHGLEFIDGLIKQGKINPVIHKTFNFNDLPKALEEVQKGHLRGKVVVEV